MTRSATFAEVLVALQRQYPSYQTDLSIHTEVKSLAILPKNRKPTCISEPVAELDH